MINADVHMLPPIFSHSRINRVILKHIMGRYEQWNYSMLRRLYRLFGKSIEHKRFLIDARKFFFGTMFSRYKVNTIDAFITKKLGCRDKKYGSLVITSDITSQFMANQKLDASVIKFSLLTKIERCVVRYLSLYYGYLPLCVHKICYESSGNNYEAIHGSHKYRNQLITYEFLRYHRIHNLSYYDLIIDASNPHKRAYKLKNDCDIRNLGITNELHNIECVKII